MALQDEKYSYLRTVAKEDVKVLTWNCEAHNSRSIHVGQVKKRGKNLSSGKNIADYTDEHG